VVGPALTGLDGFLTPPLRSFTESLRQV